MAGSSDSGGEEAKYPANMQSFASVPLGSLANPKLKAKTALQFLLRAVSSPADICICQMNVSLRTLPSCAANNF